MRGTFVAAWAIVGLIVGAIVGGVAGVGLLIADESSGTGCGGECASEWAPTLFLIVILGLIGAVVFGSLARRLYDRRVAKQA
jgi:hypothetical protein